MIGLQYMKRLDGVLVVARVQAGFPASSVDVLEGDVLVSFDGIPAGERAGADLRDWQSGPIGASRTLVFERDGQRFERVFKLVPHL